LGAAVQTANDQSKSFSSKLLPIRKGGDHSPQLGFPWLPLPPAPCEVPRCDTTSLVPGWGARGLSVRARRSPRGARQKHHGHTAVAPSVHVRDRLQGSYADGVRGGFATQTEPGRGYKCWLLHDMGHNWDVRQRLETALLLHANECFLLP